MKPPSLTDTLYRQLKDFSGFGVTESFQAVPNAEMCEESSEIMCLQMCDVLIPYITCVGLLVVLGSKAGKYSQFHGNFQIYKFI